MSKTDLHSGTFWGGSGEEVKHQIEVASNSKSRTGKTFQTYSPRRTVQHSSVTNSTPRITIIVLIREQNKLTLPFEKKYLHHTVYIPYCQPLNCMYQLDN